MSALQWARQATHHCVGAADPHSFLNFPAIGLHALFAPHFTAILLVATKWRPFSGHAKRRRPHRQLQNARSSENVPYRRQRLFGFRNCLRRSNRLLVIPPDHCVGLSIASAFSTIAKEPPDASFCWISSERQGACRVVPVWEFPIQNSMNVNRICAY